MKREVIVATSRNLTKTERKNYKKEHPGYRLCMRLRYPNFSLYVSVFSVILSLIALIIRIVL